VKNAWSKEFLMWPTPPNKKMNKRENISVTKRAGVRRQNLETKKVLISHQELFEWMIFSIFGAITKPEIRKKRSTTR
jgi:hypothetical protein